MQNQNSYAYFVWRGISDLTDVLREKEAFRPTHFSYYQVFLCIFYELLAMATLGLKEMGKFLWEDRENWRERKGLR